MKEGLFLENGELIYYKNDQPKHAGVVQIDGDVYYISSHGKAVKGQKIVHREMTNGILERGTYTFGEDYKLIPGSYIAPQKRKKHSKKKPGKKLSRKLKAVFKKHKKTAAVALAMVCCVFLGAFLAQKAGQAHSIPEASGQVQTSSKIILPTFEEDVLLCSTAAKREYDGEITLAEAVQAGDPYRPFLFEYHFEDTSGTLYLSENEDLSECKEYPMPQNQDSIAIDNLKVDTTYYYKVVVDGQEYPGTFHTAPSTRFVYIPGLVNTRDIGGYQTLDGKTVRQGLLIRGVEMDGLENVDYFIPNDQLEHVQDMFGFVYDLDLRNQAIYPGDYVSRLGETVGHKFYNAPMYTQIFDTQYRSALRQIFADLAEPDHYPMYLHCTWGTDRTGTIIFLLQGVLNLSDASMNREYDLTGYIGPSLLENSRMEAVAFSLGAYEGSTLQEKIVSFLTKDIGVSMEEIETIRQIFLEDGNNQQ